MDHPTPGAPPAQSPAPDGASPAIAQWFALKAENPDALLFLRMGDFYELFFADAEAAAGALDIALTKRGEHGGAPIPMCGVPVHAADAYLSRLIRRGFRVAVAEQMEPAKGRTGKGPLKRAVVRLVTPGTLTEDSLLEPHRPNLLLALARVGPALGAAWLDVSTGLFETEAAAPAALQSLLGRLEPAEILAPEGLPLGDWSNRRGPDTALPAPAAAARQVASAFGAASLDAFGTFTDAEAVAAAVALSYVEAAGAGTMPRLSRPQPAGLAGQMALDAATRASLEVTRTRDGGTAHTLLSAVGRTLTAPGARLLAALAERPATGPSRHRPPSGRLVLAADPTGGAGSPPHRAARRAGPGPRPGPPVIGPRVAAGHDSRRHGPVRRAGGRGGAGRRTLGPGSAAPGPVARRPARPRPRPCPARPAGGRRGRRTRLRRRAGRAAGAAGRQPPGRVRPDAGPGAALRRGVAEDQAPPAVRLRDRGPGRRSREAAGAPRADHAPGHDQRRTIRERGAGRPGQPHQPRRGRGGGAGAAGVGQPGWNRAVPCRRPGRLRLGPCAPGRAAILRPPGRGRAMVPAHTSGTTTCSASARAATP